MLGNGVKSEESGERVDGDGARAQSVFVLPLSAISIMPQKYKKKVNLNHLRPFFYFFFGFFTNFAR